ncbi:MAG: tetratricopeptide repeat protein [Myxococcales bacterium]|nr:tetratricopeptide repeat protein [Myxococcales bacterium]MCB9708425.1 tetratricopeptide repeat protein [Myxococcales bacterium]
MQQKSLRVVAWLVLVTPLLGGGNCSRARVESMNKMNEGVISAQQKQYMLAVEQLEQATAIDPANEQAFWNLAIVHIEMQKFERAKDDLKRALAINDASATYYEKLGSVLIELKSWQEAKDALEHALKLDAALFKAHYKLGQVLEELDDPQNALREYTEAIKQGPRFIEAYSALGRLYADLGYLEQARQVLEEAMRVVQPKSEEEATIRQLLGTVYQQKRDLPKAVEHFKAALEIKPGMSEALFSLGWTYALLQNRDEARRYLKKFVETGGDAPDHYLKAARDKLSEIEQGF